MDLAWAIILHLWAVSVYLEVAEIQKKCVVSTHAINEIWSESH
jgi:hypothetical protein